MFSSAVVRQNSRMACNTNIEPSSDSAAPLQPLTARALLEVRRIYSPAISPDGGRIAFVVEEPDFEESRIVSALWCADTEDGRPHRLTFSYEGERSPAWSPDGRWIAFLSARPDLTEPPPPQESEEDYPPKEQVWILPAHGGEAFRLTQLPEGIVSFVWAPDSAALIVLTREPKTPAIEMVRRSCRKRREDAYAEDEDRQRLQFWEVDLEERRAQLLYTGDPGIGEFRLSPDGNRLLFNSNSTGDANDYHRFDLFVLDLESGQVVQPCLRPGSKFEPRWSPDGAHISFVAHADPELSFSQTRLYLVAAEGGDCQEIWRDEWGDVAQHQWLPDRHEIVATAARGTKVALVALRCPGNGEPSDMGGPPVVSDFAAGPSGLVAAVGESEADFQELYLVDPEGRWRRLTDLNQRYREQYALPQQRTVRWASDGTEIEGVLTLPVAARADEPYPLLVQVHGGPHAAAACCLDAYYMPALYATEGYLVFQPNYRGSAGYGDAFAKAARGDLGGQDYRDIMAGVDHLIKEGLADPERLAIMGGSYGGYLTNWAISQTDRFRAAISMFGMFNLVTSTANSEISRFELEYIGCYYWDDPEAYRQRSPSTYLKQIGTPTLLLHGVLDSNTFIANSKEMYQALRERGVPVEFVHFPREGHGLREPNHRLEEARRCLAWLDEHRFCKDAPNRRYRIGDRVVHEGYELRVLHLQDAHCPAWDEARGRLVELAFALSSVDPVHSAWDFRIEEIALYTADGKAIRPAGVFGDIGGGRTLVEGSNLRTLLVPDRETGRISTALAAGFLVPSGLCRVQIRIADMPLVEADIAPASALTQHEAESCEPADAKEPTQHAQRRRRSWRKS